MTENEEVLRPDPFEWELLIEGAWTIDAICRIWLVEEGLHALSVNGEVRDAGELTIVHDGMPEEALKTIIESDSPRAEIPVDGDLGDWWVEMDKVDRAPGRFDYTYRLTMWVHAVDEEWRNNQTVGIRFD